MNSKPCLNCFKKYDRNPRFSHTQWQASKFCSRACFGIYYSPIQKERLKDPSNHYNWKGGKAKKANGYMEVYAPHIEGTHGKRQYEHRTVMEAHIGRKLVYEEVVHHINHDKTDNRIENLVLMSRKEHVKLHNPWGNPEIEFKRMLNQRKTKLDLTWLRVITQTGFLAKLDK